MVSRKNVSIPILFALSAVAAGCDSGDGASEGADGSDAAAPADSGAEAASNPRFGVWQIETDRPAPYRNVMTYEPYGDGGMRITVRQTNEDGETDEWGYVTMFDGVFRPVSGREGAESAVEVVDERTNRILNARDGEVTQTIVNVLSEDGDEIHNEYRSVAADGTERVSHAVYRRIN